MTCVNTNLLEPFGILDRTCTFNNDTQIYKSLIDNEKCVNKQIILSVCSDIMHNMYPTYSTPIINNIIYNMVNNDFEGLNEVLFTSISDYTIEYSNVIQQEIIDNTFSPYNFIKEYDEYTKKRHILNKIFWYYNDNVKCINNNNKYSYLNLIMSYTFYHNIINKQYCTQDGQLFLYDILGNCFVKKNYNFDCLTNLIKIYRFYVKLSYTIGDYRIERFNIDTDDRFLSQLSSNIEFVKNYCMYLNKSIRAYYNSTTKNNNDNEIKQLKKELLNISSIVTSFNETGVFVKCYMFLLKARIIGMVTNINIEKTVYNSFKNNKNKDDISKIGYIIKDIEKSNTVKGHYRTLRASITSNEYSKDFDINKLDRNMVNFIIFRKHLYDDLDEEKKVKFNIPIDLKPYYDIFKVLYAKKYTNKHLKWNHYNSTSVGKISLNNKTYTIQMTIPQMFVLMKFNEKSEWSSLELSENLGITLKVFGPILNSLLTSKILVRDCGDDNDPNLKISYNQNFEFTASDKISIVQYTTNDTSKSTKNVQLLNQIMKVLTDTNDMISEESILATILDNKTDNSLTSDDIRTVLNIGVDEKYIEKQIKNDVTMYKCMEISDDEDSDEDCDNDGDDNSLV